MLFKTLSPAYFAPARYTSLTEDGALETSTFDAQFSRMKSSEIAAIFGAEPKDRPKDADLLDKHLVGWRGVYNEAKEDVAFSKAAYGVLEESHPGLQGALATAWWKSITPTEAAHLSAKN